MAQCSFEGCGRQAKARGWCASHYEKWRRLGDPSATPPRTARLAERIAAGMKECRACRRELSFEDFYADPSRADGRRDACKACGGIQAKRWIDRNPDRVLAAQRARRARRGPDVRARDLATVADWKRANPDRVRDANHRRRAAGYSGPSASGVDYEALWVECGGKCGICGEQIRADLAWPDPRSKSRDHILPLSRGGAHSQENVQWTHLECNLRKGSRIPAGITARHVQG